MRYDIGGNACLSDEPVEGEELGIFGLPQLRSHYRIASVNGGAAIGVNGVAREERRLFEIILAYELEYAVMQVEAVAGECGDRFGKFGGVRVLRRRRRGRAGLLLLLVVA